MDNMTRERHVEELIVDLFRSAKRVFVFTGAGASRESGLPTFRDLDGEWTRHDPMTFATLDGFLAHPAEVWNLYRLRRLQIAEAGPNPAHMVVAEMEGYYPEFLLVTQNVDNLHERAGSSKMVKIHGDASQARCLDCQGVYSDDEFDFAREFSDETLPRCPECGGLCRPNIVWFGEYVAREPLALATRFAAECELMLIVGTSGEVSNGYGFAERALHGGARIVEVNPREGQLTHYAHFRIPEPAGIALPAIWQLADVMG